VQILSSILRQKLICSKFGIKIEELSKCKLNGRKEGKKENGRKHKNN
jgi:hypothetical protein